MRARSGFTLIELLVVVAIMAILMALAVPVGRSLIENTRISTCANNLHRIEQAIKAYTMDYGGPPPVWLAETATPATPYDEMLATDAQPVDPGTGLATNPLMVLYREGYLRDRTALHCPRDNGHMDPAADNFYQSYTGRQLDNTATADLVNIKYQNDRDSSDSWNGKDIQVNRFKYMPNRIFNVTDLPASDPAQHTWVTAPSDWDGRRMLAKGQRSIVTGGKQYWGPVCDPNWSPADNAIITWCDLHVNGYTKSGVGQYQVLYWDGSVVMLPKTLFTQGTNAARPADWQVKPDGS
ncbi:MAG TPA: type II secretion system protein [Armatimonadota bacterium]|jgi:prepilin-type N-terminal cleavage/methylation domain-containing protein